MALVGSSAHLSMCCGKQEHHNSDRVGAKRWRLEVPRERARKQEQDLGEEALAGSEANTSSREGLGKVVF